jgi:DNA-binding beta-propeller fold protein YncE
MNRREFLAAAAAVPFTLRSGLRVPLAFVTADTESAVVVVDPYAGRVLRRIATRPDPRSVERVGETAVVAHTAVGEVTLVRNFSVRQVLRGFGEPRYTAAAPGGRFAYVTDSGRADLAVVDVVGAQVVARLHLGGWPRHVSIDASGRTIWVALGTASRDIAVVDVTRPLRPRHVGTVRPHAFRLHDVGFVPGTRHVWVTSGDRKSIAIHDARTGYVLRILAAGSPPQHVTFDSTRAYVTSGEDGTLRVHALDGRLLRVTSIPAGSYNVQRGPGRVLTPSLSEGTLSVLDEAGDVMRRIKVADSSHDACFT